jgi:hypothetical protein
VREERGEVQAHDEGLGAPDTTAAPPTAVAGPVKTIFVSASTPAPAARAWQ